MWISVRESHRGCTVSEPCLWGAGGFGGINTHSKLNRGAGCVCGGGGCSQKIISNLKGLIHFSSAAQSVYACDPLLSVTGKRRLIAGKGRIKGDVLCVSSPCVPLRNATTLICMQARMSRALQTAERHTCFIQKCLLKRYL